MLVFYNDRSNVNKLPTDLRGYLTSKGVIVEDDIFIHFVGLVYFSGNPYIFLPRNSDLNAFQQYSISEKETIARELLSSIHVYQQSKKNSFDNRDNGEGFIGEDNLTLIISLLNDFNLNGLYKRRSKRKIINSGKANWKRSMQKFHAYPADDTPFYLEYEGIEKRTEFDSEISKIHAGIIYEISKDLGWLTYSDPSYYESLLNSIGCSELSKHIQSITVQRELDEAYSERDIFLLKSIRQYLKRDSGMEKTDLIVGIKEFHGMWENILGTVLNNRIIINKKLAAPVYKIDGKYFLASSRGQKTDIVLKLDDVYLIIDAKYYKASNTSDSPGLSDIVKQFYYVKTFSLIEKNAHKIGSIFIFPGQQGNIESIHMALKDPSNIKKDINLLDDHYPPIYCIYQDPISLIKLYANGKRTNLILTNELSELFNQARS